MNEGDRKEFGALLSDTLAYYRQEMTPFVLSTWWSGCRRYDLEQVRRAIEAHAMDPERGRFPVMLADVTFRLGGTSTDRALVAWGKVLEAMSSVGAYASVVFDDAVIHAVVVDMGGWPALCRAETKDLPHQQRRFCETYRTYATRGVGVYPKELAGVSALECAGTPWADRAPAPMMIGDARRAADVMLHGGEKGRLEVTPMSVALAAASVLPPPRLER